MGELHPAQIIHDFGQEIARLNQAIVDHDTTIMLQGEEIERLRTALTDARALVDQQAEDHGLWGFAETDTEDYLQRALRKLHAVIEHAG